MKITVKYLATVYLKLGVKQETIYVNSNRLDHLIEAVKKRHHVISQLLWGKGRSSFIFPVVNGKAIPIRNIEKTFLEDGDTVAFMPVMVGG